MQRSRSNLSLSHPINADRRHEFRYSTYHADQIDAGYPLVDSISKTFRKKDSRLHHKAHKLLHEPQIPVLPEKKIQKLSFVNNSHLFKRLAKDYILPERRLSSFRRKSWRLTPSDPKPDKSELERIMQEQESAKYETKYMMGAMLEIIEDYNIENSMACEQKVASSKSRKENDKRYKSRPFEIPNHILSKYSNLEVPRDKNRLQKLLRPQIFFEVQRLGCSTLQRIVVELYTEACPQVVLELVRRCRQNCFKRFSLRSSVPGLWIEAGLRLDCDTLRDCDIEYDMRALDHGLSSGILSFAGRYVKGFRNCRLDFSLSVNPLPEMNCTRVAFGAVISGLHVLERMQQYNMKCCDDRTQDYRIVCCGLVKR